ncbi:MAG: phosphate/phosphite/phosphonate ABC transporter substrate-binding protein [Bdellovibrionales bacterium]
MKSLIISTICMLSIGLVAKQQPASITVGFIPPGYHKEHQEKILKFAELLQEQIGVQVNVYLPKSYNSLVQALKTKKVDFAFLTSMTYVIAEKEAGAKVLLRKVWEQRDYYFSSLIVREGSTIKSLSDLKAKRIAFVDRNSTSGFLYPKVALHNKGLKESDFSKVVYAKNHKAAVEALRKGEVDVAAVFASDEQGKTGAWTHLYDKKQAMKSIWTSKHIPSDPFVVRNSFYEKNPKLAHEIMFVLKEMSNQKKNKALKDLLDIDRVELATSSQYDIVREMVIKLNLKL